jgi:4-carboxymuconolactone decarboxylase
VQTGVAAVSAVCAVLLSPGQPVRAQNAATSAEALPRDVNPESRSRLPPVKRESLDERGQKAYDAAAARSGGAPQGVAAIRLHGSGRNAQFEFPLGWPLPQLAIITTAREHDQPYEWSLHQMQATAVGLEPAVIDVVRDRKPLTGLDEKEAVVIQIGREVFGAHQLRSDTYARAVKAIGESNLVDLVDLMGNYSGLGVLLTAFNQQMPPGWKQFLPLSFTPPADIRPDSRNRLPVLKATNAGGSASLYGRTLSPEGTGPGQIRRHGAGVNSLVASVGRRPVDVAMLVADRERDSQYGWTLNELAARTDGLDAATIDTIRHRRPVTGLAEKDASIIQLGREVFERHYVSAETYARAVKTYGERDLVDLVDAMAGQATEATLLAVFDQHVPSGQTPLLPIP